MAVDLSLQHGLISDLFSLPTSGDQWRRLKLSDDQVNFYAEQGYLPGVRLLTDEQVDALRAELIESNESPTPDTVLFHALGAWRIKPGFHDILWNPAFTVAASQLLGERVRLWHDQLFCKPPKQGGVVA